MSIPYPIIRHLDDLIPFIENSPEITITQKGEYSSVCYNVSSTGLFDCPVRRECRGLIFSNDGTLIRRPFHKFMNVGESVETQPHSIDLSKPHKIYKKLDGSMIAPFLLDGQIHWGTKRGETDISQLMINSVIESMETDERVSFIDWNMTMLTSGFTPIYEYLTTDPQYRVIIEHERDELVLLALRNIETGEYVDDIEELCYPGRIVESIDGFDSIDELISHTRELVNEEGFVVVFKETGFRVKIKADLYVQMHKMKELVCQDRHIIKAELDGNLDDIKGLLPDIELNRIQRVTDNFWTSIKEKAKELDETVNEIVALYGRKDMKKVATVYMVNVDKKDQPFLYNLIRNEDKVAFDLLLDEAKKIANRSETFFQEWMKWVRK